MFLWAIASWLPDIPEPLPIRIAVAIGLTAVGGFVAGLVVQILTRTTMQLKAPGPAVNLVRIAGGTAAALGAVLWLFGTGTGTGGKGRPGDEGDGEKGSRYVEVPKEKKDERDDSKKPITPSHASDDVLKIEILGIQTLRKIAGSEVVDEDRRYRVGTTDGPKLMTLKEVVNYIVELSQKKRTPDRLNLISYYRYTLRDDRTEALETLQKLARDLGKDKVKDGWIKVEILDEVPPS
jgi:hypothetical protein